MKNRSVYITTNKIPFYTIKEVERKKGDFYEMETSEVFHKNQVFEDKGEMLNHLKELKESELFVYGNDEEKTRDKIHQELDFIDRLITANT